MSDPTEPVPGHAGPGQPDAGHADGGHPGPVLPAAVHSGAPPLVAVDAMGGDHAPAAIVAGAVAAAREHGLRIALTGRPGQLRPLLAGLGVTAHGAHGTGRHGPARHGAEPGEIWLVPAEDSVDMGEGALAGWRRPRSSIAVACQLVRRGQAAAVVSAGSTGAIVATARLRLRPLPGVSRPALAVVLPTRPGPTLLLDAGAIADPKPEMLVQFAQLGVAYAQVALGIAEPRVGLLSIGAEPGKGNKLARRAHELLEADPPHGGLPISFTGNVEGGDLLAGKVDVIVTDGFTGNVALKTLEGTAAFATRQLREAIGGSRTARLGALLQRRGLRELSERLDAETYGGAALLGLEGTVVIAHGAVAARGAAVAVRLTADLASAGITDKIRERLGPARGAHFLRRP
ncbi:MAG TPA: phosphate acyltransferase PlsX [Streptosporangiaceae bacterium]|nr:phosphate acyltransferase PlsX [Streptosporangiaceae bacterium]